MIYLLDTNAVIAVLKADATVTIRLRTHRLRDVAMSSVVKHELVFGACRSRRASENLDRIEALRFEVLPFNESDAREAGRIRAELVDAGRPIGPYDVLIAGQARARSLTLITRNLREFERVSGLRVESWQAHG